MWQCWDWVPSPHPVSFLCMWLLAQRHWFLEVDRLMTCTKTTITSNDSSHLLYTYSMPQS